MPPCPFIGVSSSGGARWRGRPPCRHPAAPMQPGRRRGRWPASQPARWPRGGGGQTWGDPQLGGQVLGEATQQRGAPTSSRWTPQAPSGWPGWSMRVSSPMSWQKVTWGSTWPPQHPHHIGGAGTGAHHQASGVAIGAGGEQGAGVAPARPSPLTMAPCPWPAPSWCDPSPCRRRWCTKPCAAPLAWPPSYPGLALVPDRLHHSDDITHGRRGGWDLVPLPTSGGSPEAPQGGTCPREALVAVGTRVWGGWSR